MTTFANRAFLAATLVSALASGAANAAVGDTVIFKFDTASQGGATPTASQATLQLTETTFGVDFLLTPNWGSSSGSSINQLQFVYSGAAMNFVDGAGPNAAISFGSGHIDSSYSTTSMISLVWPSKGAQKFDMAESSAAWSLNGSGVSLLDFMGSAISPSKPSAAFGVISMPGSRPSNWVAMQAPLSPAPEPQTYALMLAGLAVVARLAKRRTNAYS